MIRDGERRRGGLRRHRGRDHPDVDGRVRPHGRAQHPQRRPHRRVPAVRRRPRRLRDGRGRRRSSCSRRWDRAEARGRHHPRRARRLRPHVRRPPHHRTRTRAAPAPIACMEQALADAGLDAVGGHPRQRPRHVDAAERRGRGRGDRQGVRRRRPAGHLHQGRHRPPRRRGRRGRGRDRADLRDRGASCRRWPTSPTPIRRSPIDLVRGEPRDDHAGRRCCRTRSGSAATTPPSCSARVTPIVTAVGSRGPAGRVAGHPAGGGAAGRGRRRAGRARRADGRVVPGRRAVAAEPRRHRRGRRSSSRRWSLAGEVGVPGGGPHPLGRRRPTTAHRGRRGVGPGRPPRGRAVGRRAAPARRDRARATAASLRCSAWPTTSCSPRAPSPTSTARPRSRRSPACTSRPTTLGGPSVHARATGLASLVADRRGRRGRRAGRAARPTCPTTIWPSRRSSRVHRSRRPAGERGRRAGAGRPPGRLRRAAASWPTCSTADSAARGPGPTTPRTW